MQTNTELGMSLGDLLTDAFSGANKQKGRFDAEKHMADISYKNAATDKYNAEADAKRQESSYSTDDSLAASLANTFKFNSPDGLRDFNDYRAGAYKPIVGAPTQAQRQAGNSAVPQPGYYNAFDDAAKQLGALQQARALGDKNLSNIPKAIQGNQRNNITRNLDTATPQQAAEIGMRTSAIEGNVKPLEMQKAAITWALANGKATPEMADALTLSHGKGLHNNSANGTYNMNTGKEIINDVGRSVIGENNAQATESYAGAAENKAQATQAYAGANENNAQAGLANLRGVNIKAGKGDGSNATNKDMAQLRDDVRAEFNARYPVNVSGKRKGADGKQLPDSAFRDFEKAWLKEFNIDENDYYRQSGTSKPNGKAPAASAATKAPATKTTSPIKSPDQIKADFKAGKLTRKQAEAALKAQGYK